MKKIVPKRGHVYIVNFDPVRGERAKNARLALVVQNDTSNAYSPICIVAAIISSPDAELYPTEAPLSMQKGSVQKDSVVLLNQLWTIESDRLIREVGKASAPTLKQVDRALQISLGLEE